MTIKEQLQARRADILRLARRHGAKNLRIFGSVARGEADADSDVDILVEFDARRGLMDRVALKQDLEDFLGRNVDVVTRGALHWYVRDRILSEAVPL